ncbi:MAG: hypothetical protein ACRDMH_03275 [Solirubrobacterales bacterium]
MPGPTYHRGVGAVRGPGTRKVRRKHQRQITNAAAKATRSVAYHRARKASHGHPKAAAKITAASLVKKRKVTRQFAARNRKYGTARATRPTKGTKLSQQLGFSKSGAQIENERIQATVPVGLRIIRGLTGDQPGAITPTSGELASVAINTIGPEGAVAAFRALKALKAGEAISHVRSAERSIGQAERTAADAERVAKSERSAARASKAKAHGGGKAARGETVVDRAARLQRAGRVKRASLRSVERTRTAPARAAAKLKRGASAARRPRTPLAHTRFGTIAVPGGVKAGAVAASGAAASEPIVTSILSGGKHEAQGFAKAPGKTLATTGRVALGTPAAVLGIAADAIESARHGNLEPLKGQLRQQERYWKNYSTLIAGTDAQAEKVVQDKLGLIPAATTALTAGALIKGVRALRPTRAERETLDRATKRLMHQAEHGKTRTERRAAADALEESKLREPVHKRHSRRKRESERAAVREQKAGAHAHREMRKRGKRRAEFGGRKETHIEHIGRLAREQITPDVTSGDVVHYLTRHRYTAETRGVLEKILRNRESHLEPKKALRADTVHTRAVEDALLDHPDLIADPDIQLAVRNQVEIQHGRSIERHEQRTGKSQTTPEPKDEAATYLPTMRAEGVLAGRERIPQELRGKTKVRERAGHDAAKAIRGSARSTLTRARRLRATAATLRERGKPGGMYDKRATTLDDRAAKYEKAAEDQLAVVDRAKRAEALYRKAAKVEAEGGDAAPLRSQAEELRTLNEEAQKRVQDEAMADVRRVMKTERIEEPGFVHQVDVAEGRSASVPQQFPGSKTPRKERFRSGSLEAQGRIDESAQTLLENTYRERITLANHETARGFLNEQPLRFELSGAESRFVTSSESRQLRREGLIPAGHKDVPAQEFAGTIQRNDALRREYEAARYRADVGRHRGGEQRKLYAVVPSSAIRQYRKQLESLDQFTKSVRAVSRAQTGLMLGTSPSWFAFQLPATPFGILARNWSPTRYLRAARATRDVWKNAPERTRTDFEAHFGANSGNLLQIGDVKTALTPDTVRSMNRALNFAFKGRVGRFLHTLGQNLAHGGPLIGLNRRYEARLRTFAAMMEADRMEGLSFKGNPRISTRVKSFIESVGRTAETVAEHQQTATERMKGLKPHERLEVYREDSALMRDLETKLNDTLGEWGGLTDFERKLGSVVIFYPFVRYSLRWLLYAFPKNNPLKAAVLYNLAQSNDVELQKILHGTPDFLQTFGTVVTHTGEGGKAVAGISVARAAPGGNAVIEAIGSGKLDISTLVRPFQPLIGVGLTAAEGKTTFGEPAAKGVTKGDLLLRGLASLSPLTRPLAQKIGPDPSDFSKLFRAILEQPPGLKGTLVPQAEVDLRRYRTAQRLSDLLSSAFDAPKWDDVQKAPANKQRKVYGRWQAGQEAWNEIDALMRAYHVETSADQHAREVQYRHRRNVAQSRWGIFGSGKQETSSSKPGAFEQTFGGGSPGGAGSGAYAQVFGNGQRPTRAPSGGAYQAVFGK